MKHCLLGVVVGLSLAGAAYGAPLTPTIDGADINFGAEFVYATNGSNPDTIFSSKEGVGEEATAYWPSWPNTAGVLPIWYTAAAGGPTTFGGDVKLALLLDGHDETASPLDVSLTGTGAQAGADLEIWGSTTYGAPATLLWAIDFNETAKPSVAGRVSLYGYKNSQAYVLEGEGKIVAGEFAVAKNLVGTTGVVRGNIDLKDFVGFPAHYDPALNVSAQINGSYSGETGAGFAMPEPATVALLVMGGLFGLLRRKTW